MKTVAQIIIAIMIIDIMGFIAWALSGQHPIDGFYVGSITANIIKLF